MTEVQREAGEYFERGEAARTAGKYREAIAAYERAHALAPHPFALFNIALCYEKLGEWKQSADYYGRYLTLATDATDAAEVRDKIRDFRGRPDTTAQPELPEQPVDDGKRTNPWDPPVVKQPSARGQAGGSYGVGFGDTFNERLLLHGGIKIARRLELNAIAGKFGKNDLAVGAMVRVVVPGSEYMQPFLHTAATIGYAKEDDSSDAATKAPIGLEAGGGVRFGKQGRFELSGKFRFIQSGFDDSSTTVDSYINDKLVFAIDLGIAFDIPLVLPKPAR